MGKTQDIAKRDQARGYTDADLAEVMDNPPLTDEQLRTARRFADFFPELASTMKCFRAKGSTTKKDIKPG